MLATTVLGLGFEMLRITQVWQERLRRRVGWNLTDKERDKKWAFLRPLSNPRNFFHARVFAANCVLCMILFVYATLAPITCYFLAFCFLVQGTAFRHQFVYIYPKMPDSGGELWMIWVNIQLWCMIIAELTLIGYLVLKKAPVAAPLLIPLLVVTILFMSFIRQRHFYVARHLSSEDCAYYDQLYAEEAGDLEFLRGRYRHPAFKDRNIYPDNMPKEESDSSEQRPDLKSRDFDLEKTGRASSSAYLRKRAFSDGYVPPDSGGWTNEANDPEPVADLIPHDLHVDKTERASNSDARRMRVRFEWRRDTGL